MSVPLTPRQILLKKVHKIKMDADEISINNYELAPKPLRNAIDSSYSFYGYLKNVFNVTDLMGCPRKVQLKMIADEFGAKEKGTIKSKWAVFRGKLWDRALSELFKNSQILFTVVMNIKGKPVFIRGRIDAVYVNEDGTVEIIDFKSVPDEALKKKKYLKNNYVLQVAFYAFVYGADRYSILALSNKGFQYARMDDKSLKEQAYIYARKIVEEIIDAMEKGTITEVKEITECVYCPFRSVCDKIGDKRDLDKALRELAQLGIYDYEP